MYCIGEKELTLHDISDIVLNEKKIELSGGALEKVLNSYNFLKDYCKDKVIYGINTGLGPMAQYHILEEERLALQYNAIRSHSSGMGERIPDIYVKAAMVCSLNAYLKGYSGVHPEQVALLKELINRSIIPYVPEHGGVGASGDLVQLAHIALVLIGEGEVSYKGTICPTMHVFEEEGLKPLKIRLREGLSLINGTYVMTGMGAVNLLHAKNLLQWAVAASAMVNEIVASFDDYFSEELNAVKQHKGQQIIARQIRTILADSKLIRQRKDFFLKNDNYSDYIEDKVQEYYSVRCVPQILGAVYETFENAERIFANEANSSSDNPVIDIESKTIFHGGNFHGDYIASENDKVKIAAVKMSMLLERQLNFLMNNKLNNKLPPFVNLGKLGVNFGMQGVQFTATSTVAENQTLAFPMNIHSISCNNDNQDIVSMGTNAALLAKRVIDNSYQVMAIELISIMQAFDYLKVLKETSTTTQKIYQAIRTILPTFKEDHAKYKDIEAVKTFIFENSLESIK